MTAGARPLPEAGSGRVRWAAAERTTSGPPRSGRHRSPRLPVLRVVCWQLCLAAVVVAVGSPWPARWGLLLGAATLLALSGSRVRGRWLSDALVSVARFRLRRHDRDLDGLSPDECGRVLLRALVPGACVHTVELAGRPAGVVSRGEELAAVMRPVGDDTAAFVRLALSGSLPTDADPGPPRPGVRSQLVLHRGPQPGEVTRVWLTVRAMRDPNLATDAELLVALNNTVRKLHRALREAGLGAVASTETEVLATLLALTHVGTGRGTVREERRHWRAGHVSQVGLRVTGLAEHSPSARMQVLHHLLAAVPGSACTIAITVPGHSAVLRVAAMTDAAVDAAVEWLVRLAPPGIRLERMDDEHAPAVAASLPIGGGPR